MRTEVSFSEKFTNPDQNDESKAQSLADFFMNSLSAQGLNCTTSQNLEYGVSFKCLVGQHNFHLIIGFVNDEGRDWLISTNSCLGLLKKLITSDKKEHKILTETLHSILTQDQRFTKVRWYTLEAWNLAPDKDWSQSP
jgi:hypothetical protein